MSGDVACVVGMEDVALLELDDEHALTPTTRPSARGMTKGKCLVDMRPASHTHADDPRRARSVAGPGLSVNVLQLGACVAFGDDPYGS